MTTLKADYSNGVKKMVKTSIMKLYQSIKPQQMNTRFKIAVVVGGENIAEADDFNKKKNA